VMELREERSCGLGSREVERWIWGGLAYGDTISVFLSDAFSFCLALLEGVLVLEFGAHSGGGSTGRGDGDDDGRVSGIGGTVQVKKSI
jgi:hypothetical protein